MEDNSSMDNEAILEKERSLSDDSLIKLLEALSPDPDQAAAKYENIRQKLITFFRCHSCFSPEDCADITFDRVAKKIREGLELFPTAPQGFFIGVARNVLYEYWAREKKQPLSLDDASLLNRAPQACEARLVEQDYEDDLLDRRMNCLEECLNSLPDASRVLIVEYYQGDTSVKIKNRSKLAEDLGIPANTLRIRALRVRKQLRICVDGCVKQGTPGPGVKRFLSSYN